MRKYYPLIIPATLILNLFWLKNIWIGLIFGFIFLFYYGYNLGSIFFKKELLFWKIFFGIPILFASIIIISTPIYYLYKFNNIIIASLLIIISLFFLFYKQDKNKNQGVSKPSFVENYSKLPIIFSSIFLIFEGLLFYLLFRAQTFSAIRTPWQVISSKFLIIYFIATLILILLFLQKKNKIVNLIFLSTHVFLTFGIALIVYGIGYGFDPFIHRATENLIFEAGVVTPKPFYYIGQYTLVVFLSKIFWISIYWIDKLLLPILFSIFIPSTIYWSFRKKIKNTYAELIPLFILAIPLSQIITTTPQSLANFFILFFVFISFNLNNFITLVLLSLATLMIHPLAGIPLIIFVIFKNLEKIIFSKKHIFWSFLLFLLFSVLIPLMFIFKEFIFSDAWWGILKMPNFAELIPLVPTFENRYGIFYDFIYLLKNNLWFVSILFTILGIYLAKNKLNPLPYLFSAGVVFINGIILKLCIEFPDVINYEQTDYANRLFQISGYFLLPIIFLSLLFFLKKLEKNNLFIKAFFILIFSFIFTFSIYLTYPRVDRYTLSHNINTSIPDINAVKFIEKNADGENYIVLANQAVSAAALQEFGFKKYYLTSGGEIFYYPIPTGGVLYNYYLDMVYDNPTRENIEDAMNLTEVNVGYFVLNKYWTNSERIIEEAKLEADEWWGLDNNEIFVLKYIIK